MEEKSKHNSFCNICRISVPASFLAKHQNSERHLRARAAKMFYKSKSKNPYKKTKYSDSLDNLDISSLQQNNESHIVTNRVKGVWTLVKDMSTGRMFYKNRLSGHTQNNKPIGLKDEDIEEEVIQSVIIGDYDREYYDNTQEEYEVPEIGKWVEVNNSGWFGGSDVEEEENKAKNNGRADESESIEEEYENFKENSSANSDSKLEVKVLEDKHQEKNDIMPDKITGIEITENFKKELESQEVAEEIIEKPLYDQEINTSAVFKKRKLKGLKRLF